MIYWWRSNNTFLHVHPSLHHMHMARLWRITEKTLVKWKILYNSNFTVISGYQLEKHKIHNLLICTLGISGHVRCLLLHDFTSIKNNIYIIWCVFDLRKAVWMVTEYILLSCVTRKDFFPFCLFVYINAKLSWRGSCQSATVSSIKRNSHRKRRAAMQKWEITGLVWG